MKSVFLIVVFCAVVFADSFQEEHDSYEVHYPSEETMRFDDSSVGYLSCIEEGTCIPVDPESSYMTAEHQPTSEDHSYLKDAPSSGHHTATKSPYMKLCKKLDRKMQALEYVYPELRELKYQIVSLLDASISSFDAECKEGESIVDKLLDFAIYIVEKLRHDLTHIEHTERPVQIVSTEVPVEEIIAEETPGFVGSVRGIPGEHYPNYSEVPITSFSCSDKKYIPGFYADLETGCQVFHVCYEHRRESFLCPPGTIFNQPILACDYWYSSNCSLAQLYYDVNAKKEVTVEVTKEETNIGEMITTIIEGEKPKKHIKKPDLVIPKGDLQDLLKFLPIKAKVIEFQQPIKPKVPVPKVVVLPKIKPLPLVKPKLAAKAIAAIPLAKAKIVAAAALPKAKVISAATVPVFKAKVAAPIIKSKFVKLPIMKSKYAAAASVPVFKAKTAAKVIPYVKLTAKKPMVAALPVVKAKYAKAAMISPLTKKTLALGYMKLLKAKKLALMG